jgi:hypothetical protein
LVAVEQPLDPQEVQSMAVGSSTVSTINPGRVPDALAITKKFNEVIARHGGKNVRNMLLMSSTPIRLVSSYEAENQAEFGKVADALLADPEFQPLMNEAFGVNGPCSGYVSETWIEV